MSTQWYYQRAGETLGPFTREELKYLASRGQITQHDQVRRGETGHWAPVTTLQGFFPQASSSEDPPLGDDEAEQPGEPVPPSPPPARKRKKERKNGAPLLVGSGCGCLTAALLLLLLLLFLPLRSCENILPGNNGDVIVRRGGLTKTSEASLVESPTNNASQANERAQNGANNAAQANREENSTAAAQENANAQQKKQNGAENSNNQRRREGEKDARTEENAAEENATEDHRNEEEESSKGLFRFARAPQAEMPQEFDIPVLENMFEGRTAANRAELAAKEGTPESEAAVNAGLQWLVRHQNPDGSWSLNNFHLVNRCDCKSYGVNSDTAGTALALLPFLGAGHTHRQGSHKKVVKKALNWLVKNQLRSGSFASLNAGNMYAHGQATIILSEALAMTADRKLKKPAQRAVDFIVAAQHSKGGWRYAPRQPGDLSVVGWQIMALRSAQLADLNVPPETLEAAARFIHSVQADKIGGRYAYIGGSGARLTMTAEGLLCRQYTGWPKIHPGMASGVKYLAANLPTPQNSNMYYWYYATQVMHHFQGEPWHAWNEQMRDVLIAQQETEGHEAGSWTPFDGHDLSGGRVYMTALAICTLEVYYRHAPLYSD